jgi:Domain of unknown function (DUF3473)/Polysaccharide deacetylase
LLQEQPVDFGERLEVISSKLACLSLDLEADLRCPDERIRLLDEDAKLEAFLSLMARVAVPFTCFTVMSIAAKYADRLAILGQRTQVEFAVHSFSHDRSRPATADEVERSWDAYCRLWNTEPWGYRAPNCLIDEGGIARLMERGFRYDSSITPSIRFDQYGYNNLGYSRSPFRFKRDGRSLLEFPIACLALSRLPFTLSYIKLFGFPAYRLASAIMPLPRIVATYFHAYDLYADEIADNIPGWKRHAHRRNASRGTIFLANAIGLLKRRGYQFVTMRQLAASLEADTSLSVVTLPSSGTES